MSQYNQLVREHRKKDVSGTGVGRKRRKVRPTPDRREADAETGATTIASESEEDSDDFEDVDLNDHKEQQPNDHLSDTSGDEESEHGYDFLNEEPREENDTINITLLKPPPEPTKRKVQFVSKEERLRRLLIHQWYIITMICHGFVRNWWCNNTQLHAFLIKTVPSDIKRRLELLGTKRPGSVPSVQFVDILRELMMIFGSKFRVTKNGLVLKNWNELHIRQDNTEKGVDAQRFRALCMAFQGSRDLAAQAFCALMRALGLRARLVFALQPPDFTLVAQLPKIKLDTSSEPVRQKYVDNRQKFRQQSEKKTTARGYKFPKSPYPVFWVEVYNRFSKKWVSIDPIVMEIVENCPMRRKTAFEPSLNDPTHQLIYVIAYDAAGGVKDVTRRYAHHYNSKIVKKRINNKSDILSDWYTRVLHAVNRRHKWTKLDILESKEFRERDLCEGMPNSAAGFKDHPLYALESQLKQNEVIFPKDDTTKCGTFRFKVPAKSKKQSQLVPVYKRSAVQTLYSAKAWYLRGRLLKVGQQPLKVKTGNKRRNDDNPDDDDDDDGSANRLYAEFQTKMYIPPAVTDGKIPKNAYGNIDIYVPTMLPDGGVLIDTLASQYSMKIAVMAAKILEIDYAKAIVAFDFRGGTKKGLRRIPTPQEGGLLVAQEYKEAMYAVMDQLIEEEEEKKRQIILTNSLKNWKFFLTKLRILDRLNRQHGAFDNNQPAANNNEAVPNSEKINPDNEGGRSILKVSSLSDNYEPGGFMPYYESGSASDRSISGFDNGPDEGLMGSDYEGAFHSDSSSTLGSPKLKTKKIDDSGGGFVLEATSTRSPTPVPIQFENSDNDSFLEEIPREDFIVVDGEMIYNPNKSFTHNPDDRGDFNATQLNASGSAAKSEVTPRVEFTPTNSSSESSRPQSEEVIGVSDDEAASDFEFEYSDEE